ncbi:uncharacterized protein LOC126687698 [Mercurialis annua]|uniref:uncharacterized protein LOC126687698 n=1 Tax=Mercurialis annua TaxID=3986 RepID=UPI00215E968E|nr:uncharacterized protein LOC126687698 [Mercurialis annua]
MAPSKRWMELVDDRLNESYKMGVKSFIDYAFERTREDLNIRCPCIKCMNTLLGTRESVFSHLIVHGILENYTFWYHHGERSGEPQSESEGDNDEESGDEGEDDMQEILRDFYPNFCDVDANDALREEPNTEAKHFYMLLEDSQHPLYPNSKTSKLSALVNLLHIKSLGRWSNESFSMLLKYLNEELLPKGSSLPNSYYDAKKIIKALGLSYQKIDACDNNCLLFWKDDKEANFCKICGTSRWKQNKNSGDNQHKKNGKKIPCKTLRYFPLKPRLQRLFMSRKISPFMRWHHEQCKDDGMLKHPADSMAWKHFDELHESFASDPRNVRLGLASDGFQPFTNSKTPYSIWPVILIPYNVPPWMCMKQSNLILSTLIPGPEGPGDAIDVYLQPLIEELKELWENGVETYDASTEKNFQLHAALLWTINDFPAYGNLSGWSTKGRLACPCCNKETSWRRLSHSGKQCFMGHRRYLSPTHRWRNDKKSFDGTREKRRPPKPISGHDILEQVRNLDGMILTKDPNKRVKISHKSRGDNWNKKSIFFELPYWDTLLLRHNLDVMHIEKNICDSILGTIMDLKGKTKDTLKSRLDLQAMKIRKELHPIKHGDKYKIPLASYTLSTEDKHRFCLFLKDLKVPDGFSSNISHSVNLRDHKFSGLKSHDCHVLLQHLLPLAMRGLLPKAVYEPLLELSTFFNVLGAKVLKVEELKQIDAQIPITLCKLEKTFPPSFFDIMVHLPIHLPTEAMIGGPVQYRWMYFVERTMYTLKSLIRNTARPEGSIAEGFIANECMTLCSRYLSSIETKFNRLERNYDGGADDAIGEIKIFCHPGRVLGARKICDLSMREMEQAHVEFSQIEAGSLHNLSNKEWDEHFVNWFNTRVTQLHKDDNSKTMEDLFSLARGPSQYVTSFKGYICNGYRFHIEDHEKGLRTQNSGVVVVGDNGIEAENIDYYGVLSEILEIQYLGGRRVMLFRCKWWDVYDKVKGIQVDEYGIISVNCQRFLKTNEPFVIASQASQVFYAKDNKNKGWCVVRKTQPRDLYTFPLQSEDEVESVDLGHEAYHQAESFQPRFVDRDIEEQFNWSRSDLEPITVDPKPVEERRTRKRKMT